MNPHTVLLLSILSSLRERILRIVWTDFVNGVNCTNPSQSRCSPRALEKGSTLRSVPRPMMTFRTARCLRAVTAICRRTFTVTCAQGEDAPAEDSEGNNVCSEIEGPVTERWNGMASPIQ